MEPKDRRKSGWVFWLGVSAALLVLYVLSRGPAIFLVSRQIGGKPLWWAYALVYSPLDNVDYYELCPEVSAAFHRNYIRFFLPADSIERDIY